MSKTNGHESVYDANDWDILSYVHKMLIDGNVLNTSGDKPIVSFKYPDELQVRHYSYARVESHGFEWDKNRRIHIYCIH